MKIISLSSKVGNAYTKHSLTVCRKYGIPQVEFDIIMFLANNPELNTAKDICTYRFIKKNLVSVHVEKLVRSGYLRRDAVCADRRKIALSCTEKATPIIIDGQRMQKEFFDSLRVGIPAESWDVCMQVISTIEKNIESL